jgi:hypothetical protein
VTQKPAILLRRFTTVEDVSGYAQNIFVARR